MTLFKTNFALGGGGVLLLVFQSLLLGMRLATAAGQQWAVDNGVAAAWNTFLPLLHKHRHAELAGIALPLLQQFLKLW